MPAINVVAIGVEQDRFAVARERPLLDFALTWRKQLRSSTADYNRIQMLPAILFAGEHNPVVCSPMNHAAACVIRHVRKRILQLLAAMPDLLGIPGFGVGNPNRPRMRPVRLDEISFRRIARYCGSANESELLAVGGPLGSRVAVHCRRNKSNGF